MMKKTMALVVMIGLLAVMLTGCGGSAQDNTVNSVPAEAENHLQVSDYTGYWFNGQNSNPYYLGIVSDGTAGVQVDVYNEYSHLSFAIPDLEEAQLGSDGNQVEFSYANGTKQSVDGKDTTPYQEGTVAYDLEKNMVVVSGYSAVTFYYPISSSEYSEGVYQATGIVIADENTASETAANSTVDSLTGWKQGFIEYLTTDGANAMYLLEDLDDNGVPELFEFNDSEISLYWYSPTVNPEQSDYEGVYFDGESPIYYVKTGIGSTLLVWTAEGYCIGQFENNAYSMVANAIESYNEDGSISYSINGSDVTEDAYFSLQDGMMSDLVGSDWWDIKNEAYAAYTADEMKDKIVNY